MIGSSEDLAPFVRRPRRMRSRHGAVWHHPAGDHCFVLEAEEVER
jgi:hypothetical protein